MSPFTPARRRTHLPSLPSNRREQGVGFPQSLKGPGLSYHPGDPSWLLGSMYIRGGCKHCTAENWLRVWLDVQGSRLVTPKAPVLSEMILKWRSNHNKKLKLWLTQPHLWPFWRSPQGPPGAPRGPQGPQNSWWHPNFSCLLSLIGSQFQRVTSWRLLWLCGQVLQSWKSHLSPFPILPTCQKEEAPQSPAGSQPEETMPPFPKQVPQNSSGLCGGRETLDWISGWSFNVDSIRFSISGTES